MNISEYIVESPNNADKHISRFIKAIEVMTTEGGQPTGLFDQQVMIKSGEVTLNNKELDFDFTVPFDCDVEPNEIEINIYNLSQTTIAKLKYNQDITITAGYKNDTGIIFSGRISKTKTKKSGVDKVTTVYAIDGMNLKDRELKEISYNKNAKASVILKDLLGKTNLPIAVFNVKTDYTYKDGEKIDGSLIDLIKEYAKVCGVDVYTRSGKIYAHDIRTATNEVEFILSSDTGLINEPDEFEEEIAEENRKETIKGYNAEMLLQHRLHAGVKVQINSRNVKGVFSVRKGEHKYSGNELTTSIEVIK